jgi:hypothetical protein
MAEYKDKNRLHLMMLRIKDFITVFRKTIIIWLIIIFFITLSLYFNVDRKIITAITIVVLFVTSAFAGLINIIALIPFIGPIIAPLLALPFFWLINSVGYFASIVAIRKGYSKQVINYRILTIVLMVGIVIGFILGKLF